MLQNINNNQSLAQTPYDAILSHPQPQSLIEQMPTADLIFALKKQGLEDSKELLPMLSTKQVTEIIDLDGWNGEYLDPVATGGWLSGLYAANSAKAVNHFKNLDIEVVALLLIAHTEIHEMVDEDSIFPEIPDNTQYFQTPDGRYVVVFKSENASEDLLVFLKNALQELCAENMRFVHRMLESCRYETESMLEEEAFRWKDARMQDLGFPPLEEAREILAMVGLPAATPREQSKPVESSELQALDPHLTQFLSDYPRVQNAIQSMVPASRMIALEKIVLAINHIHYAQRGKMGDVKALQNCTKYAMHFMDMGLEYLSNKHAVSASDLYLEHGPKYLYQTGHTLALKLRRTAQKLMTTLGDTYSTLPSPQKEALLGASAKEPMFFEGLLDEPRKSYRPFRVLSEIALTSKILSEISSNPE